MASVQHLCIGRIRARDTRRDPHLERLDLSQVDLEQVVRIRHPILLPQPAVWLVDGRRFTCNIVISRSVSINLSVRKASRRLTWEFTIHADPIIERLHRTINMHVPDLDLLHAFDYVARPAPLCQSPPPPPESLDERRGIDRVLAGEYEWVVKGIVGPVVGRFDRVVAMGRIFRMTGFVGSLTGALIQELVHGRMSPLREEKRNESVLSSCSFQFDVE